MGKNIVAKIWSDHVVERRDGYPDILAVDLQLLHEVTSPQAFAELRRRSLRAHAPERCVATVDHVISTQPGGAETVGDEALEMVATLRRNCREFGVRLLDRASGSQGIVHVVGPELGLTQPGMTLVCGDSHTATHGAFGALAFGIGTTEVGHVLATGCLLQEPPKTMKVGFHGKPPVGVTAKDMILKLIETIGVGGGAGYVIEYTGEAVAALSMEERMTLCNMSIECGARAGLVAPDETTLEYVKNRPCAPSGDRWEEAKEYWLSLKSDADAVYDNEVEISISDLSPMVTWGTNPAQAVEVGGVVPDPKTLGGEEADMARQALDYVGLAPGTPIEGVPIDYVFIGSCTNGRLSDLRAAAEVFSRYPVADGVIVYVVPGSQKVLREAVEEGIDKILETAGVRLRDPGCSMCLAMNEDVVPAGKRCASTSNRNFVGRQGDGAITHLMSPLMAAAAAVTGRITDVRDLLLEQG